MVAELALHYLERLKYMQNGSNTKQNRIENKAAANVVGVIRATSVRGNIAILDRRYANT